jgi:hypothetical protein
VRKAEEVLAAVQSIVAGKREQLQGNRRSRRTKADQLALFERAWIAGCKERNSNALVIRFTATDKSLVWNRFIKETEGLDIDIEDFARWIAANWDGIGVHYFRKSKSYPDTPALRWMLKCLQVYSDAYASRESLDLTAAPSPSGKRRKVSSEDATAYAKLQQELAAARAEQRIAKQQLNDIVNQTGVEHPDAHIYAEEVKHFKATVKKPVFGKWEEDEPAAKPKIKLRRAKRA